VTVGAIVLGAGLSRRMGGAKLALPINGVPMLARTIATAQKAGLPLLLVTGGHADAVRAVAPDVPAVHAEAHEQGLAESLKAGLAAAPAHWDAALIILGDMPFVQPETLRQLADALAKGAPAVVPIQTGRRGNPAGFARTTWPQLMALKGDQGARPLLDKLGALEIPVEDPGIHRDIDVPEDLKG
jgi:molybdenum cofactor cytidylyltransferase